MAASAASPRVDANRSSLARRSRFAASSPTPISTIISQNGGWTGDPNKEKPGRDLGYPRLDKFAEAFGGLREWVDKADALIDILAKRKITPVIPSHPRRTTPLPCDFALYCERNLVERFFNKLKHYRAIATRFD